MDQHAAAGLRAVSAGEMDAAATEPPKKQPAKADPVKTYVQAILKVATALQQFQWSSRKQRLTERELLLIDAAESAARALEADPEAAAEARSTAAERIHLRGHALAQVAENLSRVGVQHADRALRLLDTLDPEHRWIARAVFIMPTEPVNAAETLGEIAKDTARSPAARINAAWWLTKLTTPGRTLLLDIFQAAFEARDWSTATAAINAIGEYLELHRKLGDRLEEIPVHNWEHFGDAIPAKILLLEARSAPSEPCDDWTDRIEGVLADAPGAARAYARSEQARRRRAAAAEAPCRFDRCRCAG